MLFRSESGDAAGAADSFRTTLDMGGDDTATRQALAATLEGDMLRTMLAGLKRLLKVAPINTVAARRRLADATVERGGYPIG